MLNEKQKAWIKRFREEHEFRGEYVDDWGYPDVINSYYIEHIYQELKKLED